MPQSDELGNPRTVAPLFGTHHSTHALTKSFFGLGSRPRTVACKIKMLSIKYIYKKITNKKMKVIKIILPSASHAK